jgi:DNA-binding NarL/FixJ family response regulator
VFPCEAVKTLRILIADDHDIVRQAVRAFLAPHLNWQICGEAVTGREAVAKAKQLKPDVAVLDFSMSELNGLDATRQIRDALPNTEVLIFTMYESETLARELLAAGAHGFVVKTDARRQLIPAVEALARHECFFSPRVSGLALGRCLHRESRTGRTRTPPTHGRGQDRQENRGRAWG